MTILKNRFLLSLMVVYFLLPGYPVHALSLHSSSLSHQQKRWVSVKPEIDTLGMQHAGVPWPRLPGKDVNFSTKPTVRFCFETAETRADLSWVFCAGFSMWAPAFERSSLKVEFDPACAGANGQWDCLCSVPGVMEDTLVITYSDHSPNALVGYVRGRRHRLGIPMSVIWEPMARLSVAHELGHVFGLHHEHQRPDAGRYLAFYCGNLRGYEEVANRVMIAKANDDFPQDWPQKRRINAVCQREHLAQKYFPLAVDWTLSDPDDSVEQSTNFDYDSIMMYSSFAGGHENKFVLLARDKESRERRQEKYLVSIGGHPDPSKASISLGDIERITQLYPPDVNQKDRRFPEHPDGLAFATTKFTVPGFFTWDVNPAPRSRVNIADNAAVIEAQVVLVPKLDNYLDTEFEFDV